MAAMSQTQAEKQRRDDRGLKTLYLIDGHAQVFRAYHAIRGGMSSPVTQEPTNATFGFVGMLIKLLRDYDPDYVAIALDVSGDKGTFRSQLDPEYKATRDAPPEDLAPQVQRIVEIAGLMGIPVLGVEGYEADDVIAAVCHRLADRNDVQIVIISRDKDLQQLLADHVSMFDIHKDETFDVQTLADEKGITPDQVIDMLALVGDTSDNIPGVKGIGPKTAAKLINQYGSIANLLEHLDELTPRQRENVENAKERLDLNRELVTLKREIDFDFDLDDATVRKPDLNTLGPLFKQLGFTRHLQDLEQWIGPGEVGESSTGAEGQAALTYSDSLFPGGDEPATEGATDLAHANPDDYLAITTEARLDALVEQLRAVGTRGEPIAFDTETTSLGAMKADLCGLSFAWPVPDDAPGGDELASKRGVYVPLDCPEPEHLDRRTVLEKLRPIFEDASIRKVAQNTKYDLLVLRRHGVEVAGATEGGFDTMVASYLIDATRSSHKLDNLAMAHLNYEMVPIEKLIGTGKKQRSFNTVPLAEATTYAAEDADVTLRLQRQFEPQLKQLGLTKLFAELEMPVVEVLAELEYNGITVDPAELDSQREAMQVRIDELREQIREAAGVEFNPDSPKQLADVLFSELKCRAYKRGKSGPSTDSEVLQRIADEQGGQGGRVAELILEYRQLTKLVGTYLEALKEAIHEHTGRIHASFNQTVTATGRLSSSDPNLQNIPIRTEIGRRIRKAFVAPPDHVLLSADYSQIELRMLAHLSQDPGLMKAFEEDRDIHRAVASEVFDVPLDEVNSEQRGAAKMVNFGIVYGITPHGLARRLGPGVAAGGDVEMAKRIIASYKQRYPKIDQFLAKCVETAETKGCVETIMGRRRPIPQIRSNRPNVEALGRRMAINTVVQGSAADLIKQAMVNLHRRIKGEQRSMKMLLQIHDELVFELPASAVEAEAEAIREEMAEAMDLTVPLKVEMAWGPNWMETK